MTIPGSGVADKVTLWENTIVPKYIEANHSLWVDFARDIGYSITENNIVFISGFVAAGEFGLAAYATGGQSCEIAFDGSAGSVAEAKFRWKKEESSARVLHHRCGPHLMNGSEVATPSPTSSSGIAAASVATSSHAPPTAASIGTRDRTSSGRPTMSQCLFATYYKRRTKASKKDKRLLLRSKCEASDACDVTEPCPLGADSRTAGRSIFSSALKRVIGGTGRDSQGFVDNMNDDIEELEQEAEV